MTEAVFKNRKPNIEKLLSFGFAKKDSNYIYDADLVDGQMKLTVTINADEKIFTEVIDKSSGDEYVLHRVSGAAGKFVGQVRNEYEAMIAEISAKCFDAEVFKSKQAKAVIAYVMDTYGDELVEIPNLRIKPEEMDSTVDNIKYLPGYHMNKKHWITICLAGTVESAEIYRRIDESFFIAGK